MATKEDIRVDEVVPPASPRKVWIAIAIAAAVFALINVSARAALDRYTTNRTYWLISAKWRKLQALSAPVDWLVLGDSSGNQGVQAALLEQRLGGSAQNLCTVGDMLAVNDAWMLRRHIELAGPPKNVVLVHVHDMWPRELSSQRRALLLRAPMPWGSWDKLAPPIEVKGEEKLQLLLTRYVPVVSENVTLSDWALHPSKPLNNDFSIDDHGYMRNDVTKEREARREGQEHLQMARTKRPRLSAANAQAIAEIARLAEQHGFRVFVAHAPIVDVAGSRPEFAAYLTKIEEEVRRAAKSSARLRFVLNPPAAFPAKVMENADHLTHDAARVYTERLADAILARP